MNNVGTYFYNDDLVLLWQTRDDSNYLLMAAMGPNVAGVIGSAVAAGLLLGIFG